MATKATPKPEAIAKRRARLTYRHQEAGHHLYHVADHNRPIGIVYRAGDGSGWVAKRERRDFIPGAAESYSLLINTGFRDRAAAARQLLKWERAGEL